MTDPMIEKLEADVDALMDCIIESEGAIAAGDKLKRDIRAILGALRKELLSLRMDAERMTEAGTGSTLLPDPIQIRDRLDAFAGEVVSRIDGMLDALAARPVEAKAKAGGATACERELAQALEAVEKEWDEARNLNVYFRDAVGECHLMISRNTSEYQVRWDWEPTDLPPRVQQVMARAERAEADVEKLKMDAEHLQYERDEARVGAKAEAGEPVAWMRYLQGDVFQCDKDRDDAFPVYARPAPADGALREVLDKIADIVNRRLAEPGEKDETETLVRIGTVVDAYLSPPSSWPTNEAESEAEANVHSATCPRCFLSFTCTGGCNE
jgi:hypothetical protein